MICGSRLRERGLLAPGVTYSHYKKRHSKYSVYFQLDETSQWLYCFDLQGLFASLGLIHVPSEWRLFIDTGKESLKVVLLHIGNRLPSIPLAYARGQAENYQTMKTLLRLIDYNRLVDFKNKNSRNDDNALPTELAGF